jgi:hypothetical protein
MEFARKIPMLRRAFQDLQQLHDASVMVMHVKYIHGLCSLLDYIPLYMIVI